jgi:hypothetical protein
MSKFTRARDQCPNHGCGSAVKVHVTALAPVVVDRAKPEQN